MPAAGRASRPSAARSCGARSTPPPTCSTRIVGGAADGFSRPYVAAVAYGSAFYGFVAILLSIAAARRIAGPGLSAGIVVWLGTPLLFYMYVSPPYSHACSAFAVALFVTVWLRVRERWTAGGAVALGLSGALMAMVREQDVFLALGPAVDFAWTVCRGIRSRRLCQHYQSSRGPTPARGSPAPSRRLRPQALPIRNRNNQRQPGTTSLPAHSSPQLAASPLRLACCRSSSPTKPSTGTSGRRSS